MNEVRKLDGILTVEFEDYNQMFRVRAKVSERDYFPHVEWNLLVKIGWEHLVSSSCMELISSSFYLL